MEGGRKEGERKGSTERPRGVRGTEMQRDRKRERGRERDTEMQRDREREEMQRDREERQRERERWAGTEERGRE